MLKKAFLFPGQGSQQVGMAQDFYNTYAIARECVEEADDILGESLSKIMFQGPIEKLTQTKYSQPAIFVASCAILNVFRQQHPKCIPTFCAGHSLGEFTALFAAEYLRSPLTPLRIKCQVVVPGTLIAA